ncbi:MAG: DUF2007 domain-containing protein [Bacteroidetes bacterium]|nr:DUF2007 domain-containing protein [Bacteroidota bacterium]MBL6943084.1 DUF2007 domain-containing protein [Bacteroidales bacterium]
MADDLKLIYTGSRVESLYLVEILEENGIGVMRRDTLSASVQAGWADGSPEDAVRLFVTSEMYDEARNILDDYFKSRNDK